MNLFRRIRGRLRLKFGFCPLCNSSPPKYTCAVCGGTQKYGHLASQYTRILWKKLYREYLKHPTEVRPPDSVKIFRKDDNG